MSQPSNEMTSEEAIAILFDAVHYLLSYRRGLARVLHNDEDIEKCNGHIHRIADAEMVLRKAARTTPEAR